MPGKTMILASLGGALGTAAGILFVVQCAHAMVWAMM